MAIVEVPAEVAGSEQGSAFDADRLFAYWADGKVFDPGPVEARDFDQMLRVDGKARTLEQVLTLPLRNAPWRIAPAKGDKGEAELVTDALTRPANAGGMSTPLELVIGQMTGATLFRRAFFEKVFTVRDGRVVYDKLAWRPPTTCYLARDEATAAFAGFKQRTWRGKGWIDVDIPAQRAFVYIHGQHRNPLDGTSDLDVAYAAWQTKQKIRFLWAMFLENLAMPRAVATAASEDPDAKKQLAQKIAKLKGGGVAGVGPNESVTAFETGQGAAASFEAAIRYLDSEMSGSVLAGFTDLASMAGHGRGSFALSKDQTDFFVMGREAVLREMSAAVEHWLLADLVRWNFGQDAAVPSFKLGPISEGDATQAISMLQSLAVAPSMTVLPWEFIDELTERVASYLDMDVDKIRAAIALRQEKGAFPSAPSAPLHAAVDTAAGLVRAAGATPPALAAARQDMLPGL